MLDPIKTVKNFNETSFKEKGSEFIGQVYPVENDKEANEYLISVKKKYYDATHHCYSYKLIDGSIKYSDDGEPNGTAGIRILNAIEHFELISVLVIVIRYFGGTKLGVGPLGKAYYNSAYSAIESAEIITKRPYINASINADFSMISHVHHVLSSVDSEIINITYSENALFECLISPSDIDSVEFQLNEISKGNIKVTFKDLNIYI